jgi:hypothetical protein
MCFKQRAVHSFSAYLEPQRWGYKKVPFVHV